MIPVGLRARAAAITGTGKTSKLAHPIWKVAGAMTPMTMPLIAMSPAKSHLGAFPTLKAATKIFTVTRWSACCVMSRISEIDRESLMRLDRVLTHWSLRLWIGHGLRVGFPRFVWGVVLMTGDRMMAMRGLITFKR